MKRNELMKRNEGAMNTSDEEDPKDTAEKLAQDAQNAQASSQDLEARVVAVANAVASTEDYVAATLDRMAEQQPHKKDRLNILSESARKQAAHCRRWARDHSSASDKGRARRTDTA